MAIQGWLLVLLPDWLLRGFAYPLQWVLCERLTALRIATGDFQEEGKRQNQAKPKGMKTSSLPVSSLSHMLLSLTCASKENSATHGATSGHRVLWTLPAAGIRRIPHK